MSNKGKRPMRALTPADKIEAIRRVNEGESKASVARDIGVPESTLRGWCKNEEKIRLSSRQSPSQSPSQQCSEGEPPGKRSRTESPEISQSPMTSGLDLSTASSLTQPISNNSPIELTTRRNCSAEPFQYRERRPAQGSNIAMSSSNQPGELASNMPPLLCDIFYNMIKYNPIAQLTHPNLIPSSSLSLPNSRGLRSVRSPKPGHNGINTSTIPSKTQHRNNPSSDFYGLNATNSAYYNNLNPYKYLLQSTARAFQFGQSNNDTTPTSVAPFSVYEMFQSFNKHGGALTPQDEQVKAASVPTTNTAENILHSQLTKGKRYSEYNSTIVKAPENLQNINEIQTKPRETINSDSLAGERTRSRKETRSPEEAINAEEGGSAEEARSGGEARGAVEIKSSEEERRSEEIRSADKAERAGEVSRTEYKRSAQETNPAEEAKCSEEKRSAEIGSENELNNGQEQLLIKKRQQPRRQALDNILFNKINLIANHQMENNGPGDKEWDIGMEEALDHGKKFLTWLERSSHPLVTQVSVSQVRLLLDNLTKPRARTQARNKTRHY